MNTYTNSSLTTFRRCARLYDLTYRKRIELVRDEEREVFAVGTAWHTAMERLAQGAGDGVYDEIRSFAPSPLWAEKLCRLVAGHRWYWAHEGIEILQPEQQFQVDIAGNNVRGVIDGIVQVPDGRRGIIEYKTTSFPLETIEEKLRLNTQVGIYGLAAGLLQSDAGGPLSFTGSHPDFILYDVVRKPTINPKKLTKAEVSALQKQLAEQDALTYFGERQTAETVGQEAFNYTVKMLEEGRESYSLYGARLASDIADNPSKYYARREVHRTAADYDRAVEDLVGEIRSIEEQAKLEGGFYRNPDACFLFGTCDFYGLCSNGVHPTGESDVPDGFRVRERSHPELSDQA